jgi:hypothetical protein
LFFHFRCSRFQTEPNRLPHPSQDILKRLLSFLGSKASDLSQEVRQTEARHFSSSLSGRSLEIAEPGHGAGITVWKFAMWLAVRCPFLLPEFFL